LKKLGSLPEQNSFLLHFLRYLSHLLKHLEEFRISIRIKGANLIEACPPIKEPPALCAGGSFSLILDHIPIP
jgi:hypothetical protein